MKRIEPKAGQESVWDYPRPPKLELTNKHLKIIFGGEVIALSILIHGISTQPILDLYERAISIKENNENNEESENKEGSSKNDLKLKTKFPADKI